MKGDGGDRYAVSSLQAVHSICVARGPDPKIRRPDETLLQNYRQSRSISFPSTVAELQQVCRNSVAVIGLK